MEAEQFKLLRLQSQHLLAPAPAERVVSGLIGLQAQYGANALHALNIRSNDAPAFSRYVKTWTLRGTLHLHAICDLPTVLYRGSETNFGQMAFEHESMDARRSELFRSLVLEALSDGDKTRDELKAACEREGMSEQEAQIILHPWGGLFRAMAEKGEIAYTATGNRVFTRLAPFEPREKVPALQELMYRYVEHYGPVSLRDAQTFFGIPQKTLAPYLEHCARDSFSFREQTYYTAGQTLPEDAIMPQVLFLAGFDPMLMGYRKAENPILLKNTIKSIYNNTGIVFPAVLIEGTVGAVWKRAGEKLEIQPLVKIGKRYRSLIERKAVDNFGRVAVQWVGM
ncbi:MAG: winged helix DNA-binding domain-containing protein [Eubacteriales bacterium]|nr:winged helix DNA-binding domain-containing protein [Eubacteriales bacterium]